MKIDLLVGVEAHHPAASFSQGLHRALERMGIRTRLFSVEGDRFHEAFYPILEDPPDFTCSFSDISANFQNRTSLGEHWSIPHISFLVDPPIYFLHQLRGGGRATCVDEKDCAFIEALGCKPPLFFPHAAERAFFTPVTCPRPHEVVFFGTCLDYEAIRAKWPKEERELLQAASDRVLSPKGISILEALVELGVDDFNLPRFHHEVDCYIRGKDRVEMIRSLKGYEVEIWGDGPWRRYLPGVTQHPPISFEKSLEIMQKSQIVLNSSPRFKAGAHEMIVYALLCGAAVYTGANSYIAKEWPEAHTYQFGEWKEPCFENSATRAEAGQERVLAAHTWDTRAASLIRWL